MKVKSLSRVWLFATPWTVPHQASLSMRFSRQEYWNGLPFPSRGDLLDPGIEPRSPALEADALTSEPPGKQLPNQYMVTLKIIVDYIKVLERMFSVTKLYLTLCISMDWSVLGFSVLDCFPEFAQTHVCWIGDAIQQSHPLLPSSPFASVGVRILWRIPIYLQSDSMVI